MTAISGRAVFGARSTLFAAIALVAAGPLQPAQAAGALPTHSPQWTVVHAGHLLDRPGQAAAAAPARCSCATAGSRRYATASSKPPPSPVRRRRGGRSTCRDRFVLPGPDRQPRPPDLGPGRRRRPARRRHRQRRRCAPTKRPWNARKTLDAGFTTVRNLGAEDGVTLGAARRDRRAAGRPGPRIVDAGTAHLDHGRPHGPDARLPRRLPRRPATSSATPATAPTIAAARCAARSRAAST